MADKNKLNTDKVAVDNKNTKLTQKQQNNEILSQLASIKSRQEHLQKRVDEILYLIRKLADTKVIQPLSIGIDANDDISGCYGSYNDNYGDYNNTTDEKADVDPAPNYKSDDGIDDVGTQNNHSGDDNYNYGSSQDLYPSEYKSGDDKSVSKSPTSYNENDANDTDNGHDQSIQPQSRSSTHYSYSY